MANSNEILGRYGRPETPMDKSQERRGWETPQTSPKLVITRFSTSWLYHPLYHLLNLDGRFTSNEPRLAFEFKVEEDELIKYSLESKRIDSTNECDGKVKRSIKGIILCVDERS